MIGTKKITTLIATLLVAMVIPFAASAQQDSVVASWQGDNRFGVGVDFRVNSTVIDENYLNNGTFFDRVDLLMTTLENNPEIEIVSIEIVGTASPEGPAELNHRLSNARMKSLENYLRGHIDLPDSIIHNDHYIAWPHLGQLIESDPNPIAHKEEVLEIIKHNDLVGYDAMGRKQDGRINEIQAIDGGATWRILINRYFVEMRNAWFIVVTVRHIEPEPEPRVPLMNIKINALEAATLLSNIGMEFRITPRLSFDVMGHYSPYDYFNEARKVRIFAIQPEVRYWFGESLVKGHFVGVHVPVSGFNVQLNDDYRYQDPNRALWGVGVSYGYAMPLGKKQKWGVEFTIGVGYMNIVYDVYEGVHNGKLLRTESRHYFGPTRLGIDFSYRFDMKKNKKQSKQ